MVFVHRIHRWLAVASEVDVSFYFVYTCGALLIVDVDLTQVCSCVVLFHSIFRGNSLTATGAIALARTLEHNKSLQELK